MVCCTQSSTVHPLPVWVRPGVRVVCLEEFTAGYETVSEVAFAAKVERDVRGTISFVDNEVVKVVGVDAKYPALQIQLLRQDFCHYFRKALPHEGYQR